MSIMDNFFGSKRNFWSSKVQMLQYAQWLNIGKNFEMIY